MKIALNISPEDGVCSVTPVTKQRSYTILLTTSSGPHLLSASIIENMTLYPTGSRLLFVKKVTKDLYLTITSLT